MNNNTELEVLKCDYCGNPVGSEWKKWADSMGINAKLCDECLEAYDNKTGHCSLDCCILGQCDESC